MSREAVDEVVGLARQAFSSGKARPTTGTYRYMASGTPQCCLIGAAVVERAGAEEFCADHRAYALDEFGITPVELEGVIRGWDGYSPYSDTDLYAHSAARSLANELFQRRERSDLG